MADDLEQLVLSISADTAQMRRALKRLEGETASSTRRIEQRFDAMGKRLGRSFDGAGRSARGFIAGLAGAFSVREAAGLIDASTRIENALKVAGLAGDDLKATYDQLYASAQRNAAPLEALATLYGRVSVAQRQLGVSQSEIAKLTDTVALALRVAGTDAQTASGALFQLSQALGSGTVRAEEFNSIAEGAPTIMQAAASGIREAAGDVSNLRKIMLEGNLASRALFDGIIAGAGGLETRAASAEMTFTQRFTRINNALTAAAGRFDDATKASDQFGSSLDALATFIENLDMTSALGQLDQWIDRLGRAKNAFTLFFNGMGEEMGLDVVGDMIGRQAGTASNRNIRQRTEGEAPGAPSAALQDYIARNYGGGVTTPKTGRLPASPALEAPKTISIADPLYKTDGTDKGKKAKKPKQNDFERELQSIRERTDALKAETAAQAGINPLVEDFGYAVNRASEAQALLTAAKEAGTAAGKELSSVQQLLTGDFANLTPAAREQAQTMLAVAEGYASAEAASQRLREKQDEMRQSAEDAAAFQKDLARGVVDGFLEGADASEVLGNALKKLGSRFLDLAFDAAFDPKGAGGGAGGSLWSLFTGGIGSIFGGGSKFPSAPGIGLYAKGTNYHPGGMALVGERGPELLDLPTGAKVTPNHMIPRVPALANGGRSEPSISVTLAPVIDNRGASVEAVARTQQQLDNLKADLPAVIKTVVKGRGPGRW